MTEDLAARVALLEKRLAKAEQSLEDIRAVSVVWENVGYHTLAALFHFANKRTVRLIGLRILDTIKSSTEKNLKKRAKTERAARLARAHLDQTLSSLSEELGSAL